MKKVIITTLIAVIVIIGCTLNQNISLEELATQTPESLEAPQTLQAGLRDYKGRQDIVLQLFNEALDKNKELSQLNKRIRGINTFRNDKLEALDDYQQKNANYWSTAKDYSSEIKDSTLRKSMNQKLTSLELSYNSSMAQHHLKLKDIEQRALVLKDRFIVLKLAITSKMITAYQKNEKPDIQALEDVIKEYDMLIKESTELSK